MELEATTCAGASHTPEWRSLSAFDNDTEVFVSFSSTYHLQRSCIDTLRYEYTTKVILLG